MSNVKQKSSIEAQTEILTVINVLIPKPEEQEKIISLLQKGMTDTMQHQPGFISANIHKSLDSSHVLVYAQWKDSASLQDAVKLIESGKALSMMEVFSIGNPEYHPYEVVSVHRSIEEK
ncbi:MAG: antibiotic biosynthesis monooxygenase family protein [Pleurocapsa sp. MO_192.B19]|nr:antibiotic biosynthesis monooxygenase family protein [Pleurocapsa sp. MO_192.B19]